MIPIEECILGCLLLDPSAFARISGRITEADFGSEAHRRIFRHIAQLIEAGRPSDIVTVFESMEKAGEAEQAGGLEYLGRIANNTPSLSRLDHYVDILKPEAA